MRSNPNKKCTFQKKTAFSNKTDIFFDKKATHSAVKTAKKEQWATNQSLSTLQYASHAPSKHFKFVGKPFTRNL